MFIAFEGGEGAGKSTQVALLADALRSVGRTVVVTREPGGTPAAERIRAVLLDPDVEAVDPRAEALLFAAARSDHVAKVIRPALDAGAVVITDRYLDSSLAYQGVARGLGVGEVAGLSMWGTGSLLPDLTVVLDVDPEVGLARLTERDRLERESLDWHRTVRRAFLDLAGRQPDRYLVLDATEPPPVIAGQVRARLGL
jgi:dTMP kinase